MQPFGAEHYANPSSPYQMARAAALAVEDARREVAALIDGRDGEVSFNSGGTEGNNHALWGAVWARPERRRVVVSAVEHASVLATARFLRSTGVEVVEVGVDGRGVVDLGALAAAVDERTAVVSVMAANNETGVIQPLAAVAELAHRRGAWFHTDAVQAVGKLEFSVAECGADLMTLCAHKLHGPKGVGALWVRNGLGLPPLLRGGDQERGYRAGTENVAGAVGFGVACRLAGRRRGEIMARLLSSRDDFEARVQNGLCGVTVAGAGAPRLPNTSLLVIEGVETEAVLARLDLEGFCVSSGSACASGSSEPSHVLRAMGLARPGSGVVRASWGRGNRDEDAACLAGRVIHTVQILRA